MAEEASGGSDILAEILQKAGATSQFKSSEVEKPLDLEYDVGNLLAWDTNDLNIGEFRRKPEEYLLNLARDNAQLLVNKIWELPNEHLDDIVVAKLPPPTTRLPREKSLPKPKQPTRWEQYAKMKGIHKKKEKVGWDETVQKWVPTYGYKKAAVEKEKEWLIEIPETADPNEDQFLKRKTDRNERVAKNELQRLKNLARAKKVNVPSVGFMPIESPGSRQLNEAANFAKRSTASLGKFQQKLPKEKLVRGTGKKRKFDPVVMNAEKEKSKNLAIFDKLMSKRPKLDIEKAVNKQMFREQVEKSQEKQAQKGKKGKGGKKRHNEGKRRYAAKRGAQKGNKRKGKA